MIRGFITDKFGGFSVASMELDGVLSFGSLQTIRRTMNDILAEKNLR